MIGVAGEAKEAKALHWSTLSCWSRKYRAVAVVRSGRDVLAARKRGRDKRHKGVEGKEEKG